LIEQTPGEGEKLGDEKPRYNLIFKKKIQTEGKVKLWWEEQRFFSKELKRVPKKLSSHLSMRRDELVFVDKVVDMYLRRLML
jgi:hypothetical protein